ncbi:MAG: hypothetical protein ACK2VA_08715 [Anaerolineae bacterium]|jgi:hypothetical protein
MRKENERVHNEEEATPPLLDMTAVAERVLTRALESCARRMGLEGPQQAAYHVRNGSAVARMYYCSSMAKQVAECLGPSEQNIRAIYAPDYDVLFRDLSSDEEPQAEAMICLLVWTRLKTAALDSLVTAWKRALTEAYRDTIDSQGQVPLLEVQVMDDADVEKHLGSGWREGMATRLAVHWLWARKQAVNIVYDRKGA